jgi:methylenetetrahydrofolate reductase (NADPH)
MESPIIHPNWNVVPAKITDGFSLEITANDVASLRAVAENLPRNTPIAITFLPGEDHAARILATRTVRQLGFEPMPHFSARRIGSFAEFDTYLRAVVDEAGVRRCLVVAGDPAEPAGPFHDSSALIATGAFERSGITAIGIGGHPEGHPHMTEAQCFAVLETKCADIERRGMAPLIVTQFGFDAQPVLGWLSALRMRGIAAPVRIGVPGPAGIKTLMRFAARCGVAASASVLTKYGISITRLIGTAGPDKLVDALADKLGAEHGRVRLHFYPFGGLEKTVGWIAGYQRPI